MHYVIYIDVLFLLNMMMNTAVLMLTGRVLGKSATFLRILLSSLTGAGLYCLWLVIPLLRSSPVSAVCSVLTSIAMVCMAYRHSSFRGLIKSVVALHMIAFFMGGAIQGIYSYTKLGYYVRKAIKEEWNVPMNVKALIALTIVSYVLMGMCLRWYRKKETAGTYYSVLLGKDGKRVKATALLDTGNSLREPISQKPVMVMNMELIQDLYDKNKENEIKGFYEKKNTGTEGMYLIPYHTVGEDGIMAGFCLDYVLIVTGDTYIRIDKPYAAVSPKPVSHKNGFQVLLQPDFFAESS